MDVRINQPDEPGRERILPGVQWIEEVVFGGSFEGQCGLRRGGRSGKTGETAWGPLPPKETEPTRGEDPQAWVRRGRTNENPPAEALVYWTSVARGRRP